MRSVLAGGFLLTFVPVIRLLLGAIGFLCGWRPLALPIIVVAVHAVGGAVLRAGASPVVVVP